MKEDRDVLGLTEFVGAFTNAIGLDNFHLMGHSVRGGVALNYSLRFPDKVRKLVLVSSLCPGGKLLNG